MHHFNRNEATEPYRSTKERGELYRIDIQGHTVARLLTEMQSNTTAIHDVDKGTLAASDEAAPHPYGQHLGKGGFGSYFPQ